MGSKKSVRLGNMSTMARLMSQTEAAPRPPIQHKRRLVAQLCQLLGSQYSEKSYQGPGAELSPRLRQTLGRLLAGDSEKQIGRNLRISKHTVHVYIKRLYRHYDVNSRGELLAKFVRRPFEEEK